MRNLPADAATAGAISNDEEEAKCDAEQAALTGETTVTILHSEACHYSSSPSHPCRRHRMVLESFSLILMDTFVIS